MRASLIVELIQAYHKGEMAFISVVKKIADEEEKKGNKDLSKKLMLALKNDTSIKSEVNDDSKKALSFMPSAALPQLNVGSVPKDKDSALDLYEIMDPQISFKELVYGENILASFKEIINEWKQAQKLFNAGMLPTRKVLLYGPPGCGKTVAGFALAKEIGLKVAYVRLDSVFSSYLGQTNTNLRRIFDSIKSEPIMLFLDEFDAVAKKRDDNQEIGEIKRIVISLLQNFDFLPPNVLVVAATNHHHLLDPAVWRRFDLAIPIDLPDIESREKLLSNWLLPFKSLKESDIETLATITEDINPSKLKDWVHKTLKNLVLTDNKSPTIDLFIENLINMFIFEENLSKHNEKEIKLQWAKKLNDKGISLRVLEKATGIPKSTLSDHIKQMEA
jgi:SpoVK/Ycf46/Vps4 family AAA+-type ATPase